MYFQQSRSKVPSGVVAGHCNLGYAGLRHFHTDRKVTELPNAGSTSINPNGNLVYNHCIHGDHTLVDICLTWEATFIINIGEPGTSPCTCLNNALTSSSLWT